MSDPFSSAPETSAGSPGAILRRCREFHGITLEEASETTKIGISHLKALEGDQIREFANQAYLKGFLRIYATYLGLNSDDVARMYEKLFGVKGEKPDLTRAAAIPGRPPRRLPSLKKMLFPASLLIVILVTAKFFKPTPPPLVRQVQPVAAVTLPLQNAAVQMVQSSVRHSRVERISPVNKAEKRLTEPADSEITAVAKRPLEAGKGLIVKIKVTQTGTLTSTVDGSSPQQQDLTIGDVIEWKAEKKVTLELSNAGGVDVELNGKPYKPLGPAGKQAYIELDADALK
ncbi:MAG: RodZ domain-containing protein [Desulfuromonadales bacterium]